MKADEASLARLTALAQGGDRAAYLALLTECQHWLKGYFGRRVAPNHLDDLVQETLMALHQKLATYDPGRAFLPWLAAIARYRWVDQLRRFYRAAEDELDYNIAAIEEEPAIAARISLDRLFEQLPSAQAHPLAFLDQFAVHEGNLADRTAKAEAADPRRNTHEFAKAGVRGMIEIGRHRPGYAFPPADTRTIERQRLG